MVGGLKFHSYERCFYTEFNYNLLSEIEFKVRAGRSSDKSTYNDCFIMLDTETSKRTHTGIDENYIVAFSIAIRAKGKNICTLYGNKPTECVNCIFRIMKHMNGEKTIIYIHNMAYDWVFLRRFLMARYGLPIHQLNTKSHYPINIEFMNGLILKDSYILAQRGLEKWAKDLNVEHKKAVGKWDYDKIRTQNEKFTNDELDYIECDVVAGVECLDTLRESLNKKSYSMPFTATGIPREELRKISFQNRGRDWFQRLAPTYDQYKKLEKVYHGGYTHANRHFIGQIMGSKENPVTCKDFASSYPYVLLSEKYPAEKFMKAGNCSKDMILKDMDDYAFMFKFIGVGVILKDDDTAMPALQMSKCVYTENAILDNGRILYADYIEIYLNEQDLSVINEQYDFIKHLCTEVEYAKKSYLPRWFTDYVFRLFTEKTQFKGGDKVLYALSKAKLNSVYGMCVQKCVKELIEELYETGEFQKNNFDKLSEKEEYEKYLSKRTSFLPYQIGVWVTSYAFKNLFTLGKCCRLWLYSDTDSCYGLDWNEDAVKAYNDSCKKKLTDNGYGAVMHNGREYWLGVAEQDGESDQYSEYTALGAKRYCGRCMEDNEIHITVAGVPKSGAACLNNDIHNFRKGTIFYGHMTGKKQHTYFFKEMRIENGLEMADSIDLSPADYLMDAVEVNERWRALISETVYQQIYDVD